MSLKSHNLDSERLFDCPFIEHTSVLSIFFLQTTRSNRKFPMHSAGEQARETEPKRVRNKFTQEEDDTIVQIVSRFGAHSWRSIAANLPGRTARQIRERYVNYLAPNVCKDPWTPEEDQRLRDKVAEHGRKWSLIARFFENRTDVTLKNRWLKLQRGDRKKQRLKSRKTTRKRVVLLNPNPPEQPDLTEEANNIILDENCDGWVESQDFTVSSPPEWDVLF